ncbi:hypothetical protein ACTXT7_012624 [Hymenolepis weldensis]
MLSNEYYNTYAAVNEIYTQRNTYSTPIGRAPPVLFRLKISNICTSEKFSLTSNWDAMNPDNLPQLLYIKCIVYWWRNEVGQRLNAQWSKPDE